MVAGAGLSGVRVAAKTGYTVHIQRIVAQITTDAAQSLTFKDTAGTPVVIALIPASPGVGIKEFDYGEHGIALTADKGFEITASAAGLAGPVYWQGYRRPTPGFPLVPSQV